MRTLHLQSKADGAHTHPDSAEQTPLHTGADETPYAQSLTTEINGMVS